MVGKSGDTVQIAKVPVQKLSAEIQKSLTENPDTELARINYKKILPIKWQFIEFKKADV